MARACWCRDCQYLSSGNASINVVFASRDLSIVGVLAEFVSEADSGSLMRRRFCPNCGTPMFSEVTTEPDYLVVRAGTLDDPAIARPESVIWTASKPEWALLDPSIPCFAGQVEAAPLK